MFKDETLIERQRTQGDNCWYIHQPTRRNGVKWKFLLLLDVKRGRNTGRTAWGQVAMCNAHRSSRQKKQTSCLGSPCSLKEEAGGGLICAGRTWLCHSGRKRKYLSMLGSSLKSLQRIKARCSSSGSGRSALVLMFLCGVFSLWKLLFAEGLDRFSSLRQKCSNSREADDSQFHALAGWTAVTNKLWSTWWWVQRPDEKPGPQHGTDSLQSQNCLPCKHLKQMVMIWH